ncbi:hypothetical protein ACX156_26395 [Bacillus cereus]|uniref:hypothetical protein n=1 Tax=Bacilli TaxID=91061 RepID=UPI0005E44BD1|nr:MULTISPECIES: hypothetical protein [Bacilli]HDR7970144.1 hypothetical protein [Bacillus pacificus]MBE7112572.1 hypothetical protein [Bacillus paranthracis]MCU5370033.1 hypothetical protein [Bacillus paranthracis]MDA2615987.1 hypothetical protein [Bacillus cereus]MEB8658256.1 hypothetical protein [Bacillus cereus]
MSGKKRLHVTVSEENYIKCEEVANRYGITVNAFMAFIIGQWIDFNYEANTVLAKKVEEAIPDVNGLLNHPKLLDTIKTVLEQDKEFQDPEFRENVRKQLSI